MNPVEALLIRYRDDPVTFCNDMFPETERPREWQPEVLAMVMVCPWIAIVACRKAGKTRLAAFIALWFLCTHANSLVVTIAPIWRQVTDAIWTDIRHLWFVSKLSGIFPEWQILQSELHAHPLLPKWRALGLASVDSANIEGAHPAAGQPTLAIIDESFNVSDEFFTSLQGMLSEGDSKIVAIGRGGLPRGWYYRAFSTERHLWGFTKRITGDTIPRLAEKCASERERLKNNLASWKQQWMGEFTGADEGSVLQLAEIEAAIGRAFTPEPTWRKVCALDVAGESVGGDENVLTCRFGPVVIRQVGWSGMDEMQTAYKSVQLAREFGCEHFIYDMVGVGAGVGKRIKELLTGIPVNGFNAGRVARDTEQFANIKAEEIFALRARFIAGEIAIPNDPMLISQLCGWTKDFTPAMKTKIIDPPDSPDYADSLLMAFAADRIGKTVKGWTPGFLQ